MIVPFLKDEALIENIRSRPAESENFDVWWLGQSGYLIHWQGRFLLLDPYLSDSLTEKYAATDKPHVRMTELVVHPNLLDFVDVVTSSHNHTDHLDASTLVPILDANPNIKFIIPEANRAFVVDRLGCNFDFPIGLNDGQQVLVDPFRFYGIPAAHNNLDRDKQGCCFYMGVHCSIWSVDHLSQW